MLHTSWLKRNNNNRTFYAELANMDLYKFHHAKENQISHISPRGVTFMNISSFHTDAVTFSQNLSAAQRLPDGCLAAAWKFFWQKNITSSRQAAAKQPSGSHQIRKKIKQVYLHLSHASDYTILAPPGDPAIVYFFTQ